jgi:hypothetical protein
MILLSTAELVKDMRFDDGGLYMTKVSDGHGRDNSFTRITAWKIQRPASSARMIR